MLARLSSVRRVLVVAFLLAVLGGGARSAAGQSIWLPPYQPNQVAVQTLRPVLDAPGPARDLFPTGVVFISGTVSVSERLELVGELPLAAYREETTPEGPTVSTSALGNPYLGVWLTSMDRPFMLEAGVRLPLADGASQADTSSVGPNPAFFAGQAGDIERRYAFVPDRWTTEMVGNLRVPLFWGAHARVRSGGFLTGGGGVGPDLGMRYGLQLWREGGTLTMGLGANGRLNITGANPLPERVTHDASGTVIAHVGRVHPSVVVGLPLSPGLRERLDIVFGFALAVQFSRP